MILTTEDVVMDWWLGAVPAARDQIVCDLDGTLASCTWRRHFVEPLAGNRHKDWRSFFAGVPFDPVHKIVRGYLVNAANAGCKIVYVSARPEDVRRQTMAWLHKHECPDGRLLMRASGDSRHDPIVKEEILMGPLEGGRKIHTVIDDRPQVVEMWTRHGLRVWQVTDVYLRPFLFGPT